MIFFFFFFPFSNVVSKGHKPKHRWCAYHLIINCFLTSDGPKAFLLPGKRCTEFSLRVLPTSTIWSQYAKLLTLIEYKFRLLSWSWLQLNIGDLDYIRINLILTRMKETPNGNVTPSFELWKWFACLRGLRKAIPEKGLEINWIERVWSKKHKFLVSIFNPSKEKGKGKKGKLHP